MLGRGAGAEAVTETDEHRFVPFGQSSIRYQLFFSERQTLQLTVKPDLEVHAIAPVGTSPGSVDEKVRSRAPWILRQLREFALYHPLPQPRRYVSGESHSFLGRQYRLRVQPGPDAVELRRPFLVVASTSPESTSRTRELLERWYRRQAERVLREQMGKCLRLTRALRLEPPRLRIRRMRRRWGSCTPSGTITLNVDLVKASTACIDYVIVHELCHLREPTHGPEFYALLSRYLPDWRERRQQLNGGF